MFEFLTSESGIRLGWFAVVLSTMAILERFVPRRPVAVKRSVHWSNNLGLAFLNTLVLRLVAPLGAIGVALLAYENGWGLWNRVMAADWFVTVTCVIALDLIIYFQHIAFHRFPVLWRMHLVHHADREFDVTTGLRFHTFEILLSCGIKCLAIVVLGATPLSVLIFEVLLNASSLFNHSNVHIPRWLDRVLRCLIVTPDMHRVHHSVIPGETGSNFGFSLSWWDFLFRTYRDQPKHGHAAMTVGLPEHRGPECDYLPWMLAAPFFRRNRSGNSEVRSTPENSVTENTDANATHPATQKTIGGA